MAVKRIASQVVAPVSGHRQVSFRMAIVQRRAPGAYGFEFGQGKLAVDALATYLLGSVGTPEEMTDKIDNLGAKLRDHAFNRRVFENLFPNMQQQLQRNQVVTTVPELQEAISKAMGRNGDPATVAVYTELLTEVFAAAAFVKATKGYMHREIRLDKFPTYFDLVRECMRSELSAVLKEAPLRISISNERFTPAYIHNQFQDVFSKLGGAIARIGYQYRALQDTAYLVTTQLMHRGSSVDQVPEEVARSAAFAELMTNFTFVRAALSAKISRPANSEWEHARSVNKVLMMLNLSERYELVPLEVAIAHYQYDPVFDGRSNMIGGVLSYRTSFKHPVKVGMFEAVGNVPGVVQMTQLPNYEEEISRALGALNGWDPMSAAHSAAVTLMSTLNMSELEDRPRSVLFCPSVLSEGDLLHIAVAKADMVFMPDPHKDNLDKVVTRLVFCKDLAGKRLFADEIPFEGTVYTTDAATLVLCCDKWDAKVAYDLAEQEIPAHLWDNFIVGATDEMLLQYGKPRRIEVEIGGSKAEVELDLNSMLYLLPRSRARMVLNPISQDVMSSALTSLFDLRDMIAERMSGSGQQAYANEVIDNQLAQLLNAFIEKLYGSNAGQQIVKDTVRRLAVSVSPENRELTYSRLQQAHYRLQVAVEVAIAMMEATGILGVNSFQYEGQPEGENITLGGRVSKYLRDNRFYSRMIGAMI